MAPAVTIDNTPDFSFQPTPKLSNSSNAQAQRTLLLAPPSVASHPEALAHISAAYDRAATDIQMLDRLALGLVSLPPATYDLVLLLTDAESASTATARPPLSRQAIELIAPSLKANGQLQAQNGELAASEQTEAILAGLVKDGNAMVMPQKADEGQQTVMLKFGARKGGATAVKRKSEEVPISAPAGVGFVNGDELNDGEDDEDDFPSNEELQNAERIDPNTLLTAEDRMKPLNIPEACKPNSKRRRACKDCTCGLAERLEAEDKATRAEADAGLAKLNAADLNEVDFTVKGKVGSCGNCALGDAFRCDGCPYIGLPAFKPGEEVRLLNNDVQL